MNTQAFWEVIGSYNSATWRIQIVLLAFLFAAVILSYRKKTSFAAKLALGAVHLFIGIIFFGIFGTEAIQKFFALPLYICCGVLFIYEGIINRNDVPKKPDLWQSFLLFLYAVYPLSSFLLGHDFPQTVTYIMPCPVVCLGITVYSLYPKKNKILLALLTLWGLTGVKSVIFNVYEDLILLLCGIYGAVLFANELRAGKKR